MYKINIMAEIGAQEDGIYETILTVAKLFPRAVDEVFGMT